MPKFVEQILEMYELKQEFMGFEEQIPDFSDEEIELIVKILTNQDNNWHKSEAEIEEDGHVW